MFCVSLSEVLITKNFMLILAILAVVLAAGCVEQPDAICSNEAGTAGMSLSKAMQIAEASECAQEGTLAATHMCNSITGTWWIDLTPNEPKDGCNPACVVNVATETAEINWRCTGLIP